MPPRTLGKSAFAIAKSASSTLREGMELWRDARGKGHCSLAVGKNQFPSDSLDGDAAGGLKTVFLKRLAEGTGPDVKWCGSPPGRQQLLLKDLSLEVEELSLT